MESRDNPIKLLITDIDLMNHNNNLCIFCEKFKTWMSGGNCWLVKKTNQVLGICGYCLMEWKERENRPFELSDLQKKLREVNLPSGWAEAKEIAFEMASCSNCQIPLTVVIRYSGQIDWLSEWKNRTLIKDTTNKAEVLCPECWKQELQKELEKVNEFINGCWCVKNCNIGRDFCSITLLKKGSSYNWKKTTINPQGLDNKTFLTELNRRIQAKELNEEEINNLIKN